MPHVVFFPKVFVLNTQCWQGYEVNKTFKLASGNAKLYAQEGCGSFSQKLKIQ